jgi:hypothetical protein
MRFKRSHVDVDRCATCGLEERSHVYHCTACGTVATEFGSCNCGMHRLPKRPCDCPAAAMVLLCPPEKRTLTAKEWAEHCRVSRLVEKYWPETLPGMDWERTETERLYRASLS